MVRERTVSKSEIPLVARISRPTAVMTPLMSPLASKIPSYTVAREKIALSMTGTVTNSTLIAGSGADLLNFNNVVGNASIKGFGSAEDSSNDTVVLASSATDINVDFAAGADSLSLAKGATNATVAAAAGNDTVVAALTVASSSIQAAAGDDSCRFLLQVSAP